MGAFDCLITDLDGTLCDSLSANVDAYSKAFDDLGLTFDGAAYRRNFGLRFNEMMVAIAPNLNTNDLKRVQDLKSKHYTAAPEKIQINQELVRILRYAKSSGCLVGLATTARQVNAAAILKHHDLIDIFDAVIWGEDVTNGKPNPECYEKLIAKLGVDPESTLIFEDSEIGVSAAKTAGAKVIKVMI